MIATSTVSRPSIIGPRTAPACSPSESHSLALSGLCPGTGRRRRVRTTPGWVASDHGQLMLKRTLQVAILIQDIDLLLVWVTSTSRPGIVTTYARAAGEITAVDESDPEYESTRLLA